MPPADWQDPQVHWILVALLDMGETMGCRCGWRTAACRIRLARRLVERLDLAVPWWHFGDLDPAGLAIFATLRDGARRPRLFLPDWWQEYLDTHRLPLATPWPEPAPDLCPQLVRVLRALRRFAYSV